MHTYTHTHTHTHAHTHTLSLSRNDDFNFCVYIVPVLEQEFFLFLLQFLLLLQDAIAQHRTGPRARKAIGRSRNDGTDPGFFQPISAKAR